MRQRTGQSLFARAHVDSGGAASGGGSEALTPTSPTPSRASSRESTVASYSGMVQVQSRRMSATVLSHRDPPQAFFLEHQQRLTKAARRSVSARLQAAGAGAGSTAAARPAQEGQYHTSNASTAAGGQRKRKASSSRTKQKPGAAAAKTPQWWPGATVSTTNWPSAASSPRPEEWLPITKRLGLHRPTPQHLAWVGLRRNYPVRDPTHLK